jgi:primosomal protein N' (replication factor Y)
MIVGVHPLAGFDKLLHYRVPESLRPQVGVGSLVRMPILQRISLGMVGEIGAPRNFPVEKLKPLSAVVYPFPALPPDLLELARWMAAYYAAPLDSVIEAMLPAAVRRAASLKQEKSLVLVRPLAPGELAALAKRAPAQAKLCAFLAAQFRPPLKSLVLSRLGLAAATVGAAIEKGFVREETRRVERVAYADDWADGELVATQPHAPNSEQQAAAEVLAAQLAKKKFCVTVLHGVTGSGKTEVYLRAIDVALRAGGGIMFLVPEVALTPQTVARLRARMEAIAPGLQVVVWHSHLSEGERLDGWLALATGGARVVVGARSAVFAPVPKLQLVIVDEEHEPAYKQDETPRYHGRDVAVMRAKLTGAVCVLGSATPSLETIANAQAGKYQILRLKQRVDDRRMPFVNVVDMRIEVARQRHASALSRPLARRCRPGSSAGNKRCCSSTGAATRVRCNAANAVIPWNVPIAASP